MVVVPLFQSSSSYICKRILQKRFFFTATATTTILMSAATAKLESPSAERNKEPIWSVLESRLVAKNKQGSEPLRVLEVAAGAGGKSCPTHVECCESAEFCTTVSVEL
jgi:NaMN:DMB phosphoribosyltransferase